MATIDKNKQHYAVKSNGLLNGSIKDVSTSSRIVTGFYNAYNFFDSTNDVLLMGCAKKSIKERGPDSEAVAKIKHALNHDLTQLPGKILTLKETEIDGITGLYFETKMADTTLGNDTLKNYLEGIYDNHSIGFRYVNVNIIERESEKAWNQMLDMVMNPKDMEQHNIVYAIKEIMLYEGSTVAFGANSLTPFLGTKNNNPEVFKLSLLNRINTFEKTLRTGSQSDEAMQSIELQSLQLKQMVAELCELIPAKQVEKQKNEKDIENEIQEKGFISDEMINNFKLS